MARAHQTVEPHTLAREAPTTRIPSRVSPALFARLEAWIAEQRPRPTKTAAIEYLLDLGLNLANNRQRARKAAERGSR